MGTWLWWNLSYFVIVLDGGHFIEQKLELRWSFQGNIIMKLFITCYCLKVGLLDFPSPEKILFSAHLQHSSFLLSATHVQWSSACNTQAVYVSLSLSTCVWMCVCLLQTQCFSLMTKITITILKYSFYIFQTELISFYFAQCKREPFEER